MEYIDLHVHSNVSDGTLSPSELVAYAAKKGLFAFALTDHDTVAGIDEAIEASKSYDVKVIPGIEISSNYKGTDIHILGLNINYKDKHFLEVIEKSQLRRKSRNKLMISKMRECGFTITPEIEKERFSGISITRAHFASFLQDYGYVTSKNEAFQLYLNKGCPCYVPKETIPVKDSIKLILDAGGIPVLAHPTLYKLKKDQIFSLANYLKSLGLLAIEALYSTYSPEDEAFIKSICKSTGLFMSGGSDYHGSIKPHIDLGTGKGNLKIPVSLLQEMGLDNFFS